MSLLNKKDQTSDDTVGQLSRYMGWIKEHIKVLKIIVAGKFDEKIKEIFQNSKFYMK